MKNLLYVSTGLGQLLCATAVQAQVTPPPGVEAESTQVEDIVVTANRREQRLQDVPVAVTALSANELARSNVTTTQGLTQAIPALNLTRANAAVQPTLRGVGTRSAAPGDEANVAVYLDGVYQPTMAALGFNLLNVERVEVLRGPQGTLFGRNSTGGLINVITSDPGDDFELRAVASYGSYDAKSAQTYISGPLGPTLSANLNILWSDDNGYLRDLVRGGRANPREEFAARGKLLFEPSDNAEFKLTLGYFRTRDGSAVNSAPFKGNTSARSLANNPNVLIPSRPWETGPTVPRDLTLKQYSGSFEARFDLGGVSLQNTGSYQHNKAAGQTDVDGTPFNGGGASSQEISRYYTEEIRLLSTTPGPFQWIVGAFYFNGRGQFDPVISSTATTDTFIYSDQRTRSYAGFAEGTYEFTPAFSLTAGLRYTSERRHYTGQTMRNGAVLVAGGVAQQVDDKTSFNQWTYRAALQYKLNADANVYASYSRGFKSGVFNSFSTNPLASATKPEILDAYEIGLKSDPLRWLRFNLSAFHYDYRNIQLSARDPVFNLVVLLNAASARINGAEAELTAAVTRNFNLRAFATILDAKYTNFPDAQIFAPVYQDQTAIGGSAMTPIGNVQSVADQSGRDMIRAPRYTFGLSGDYSMETDIGKVSLSASVYHTGRFYWDVNNRLAQPAYALINSELSWTSQDGHLGASLWVKNLTNEVIYQSLVGTAAADLVTYDRPRTVGGSVRLNF